MNPIKISELTDVDRVVLFDATDKDAVLRSLCAVSAAMTTDPAAFEAAIFDRERIMPTGIGLNVAVPHVKISSINSFFVTIGIVPKGVDWNALDGEDVHIVFLIGGPEGKQQRYLGILSKLALIMKNAVNRDALSNCNTAAEAMTIMGQY